MACSDCHFAEQRCVLCQSFYNRPKNLTKGKKYDIIKYKVKVKGTLSENVR